MNPSWMLQNAWNIYSSFEAVILNVLVPQNIVLRKTSIHFKNSSLHVFKTSVKSTLSWHWYFHPVAIQKYHCNKDSGVITYIYMFCTFQYNAGQLSEMQFCVVEFETKINTYDIWTFGGGGGGGGTHRTPNYFPNQNPPIAPWIFKVRKAFFFKLGLPEGKTKLSLPFLFPYQCRSEKALWYLWTTRYEKDKNVQNGKVQEAELYLLHPLYVILHLKCFVMH
jgi:hypothetical protein